MEQRSRLSDEFGSVRHYYGDVVRVLFVIVAILVGVTIPLSGDLMLGTLIGGPVAIVLVVLAGFTNPHGKTVFMLSAVVAGIGVIVSEILAVVAYTAATQIVFATLELICILFVVALYYSIKNFRAALMHKIGKIDGVGEFDDNQ